MPQPPEHEIEVFNVALELPAAERSAYLDGACADDAALRQRVEELLKASEESCPCLEGSVAGSPGPSGTVRLASVTAEKPGDRIGRYKLLQQIGEGGCGIVYMAEQEEPVRRRVALKVIKLGMDTKQVIARFEAERQALALMDHPNIARVLDAGATDAGRPYFVMELVRGVKITDYCDQNNLSTRERLDLFMQVCRAIQHAHQKGIIHRDIKPSNILVTMDDRAPVPKVIDFGIAKATQGKLTDQTLFTAFEQFVGTPAYMSPEQAEMRVQDIDTRSDIYSLGVLLYELLTGQTPFDAEKLMAAGLNEIRRTIREREPARPSTRLSTMLVADLDMVAGHRQVPPPRLIHLVRGDLDWIVMKALEKDRTRRYETANGLAMDITRHLNCEPVLARPPSRLYEFQKTVRRHKFGFAACAAVITILAVGVVASSWEAARARRAEQEQVRLREEAQKEQANEAQLRHQAEAQELADRRTAYASDMNLAQQALAANNLGRVQELLNRQRPQPGQKDLRGWEWRYLWQYCYTPALFTLPQTSNSIWTLSASRDGRWLAVGENENGGLLVWDLSNRRVKSRLPAGDGKVHAAFSPSAPLLAYSTVAGPSTNRQASIRLWEVTADRSVGELPLGAECVGLGFSADGQTLVTSTASTDNQITLWRVSDRTKLAGYSAPQNAVDEAIPFAITPDASMAAYGSPTIHLLDLATGQERWHADAAKDYVMALAFSPDGKILASSAGYHESSIRFWDVTSGKEIARLQAHGDWVGTMAFWPDGKALASSSEDGTIRVWNLSQFTNIPPPRVAGVNMEMGHVILLPDNTRLVSGDIDGSIRVWDTARQDTAGSPVTLPVRLGGAWRVAPDSQSLLTVAGGQVARWTGKDFQQMEALMVVGNSGDCRDYLFSKDSQLLAVTSKDGNVRVWDLPQREIKYQFKCPGAPSPVAFRSGGRELVVADRDGGALHEWNLTTGKETRYWRKPKAGSHWYGGFAFSPDDRWHLSVDSAGTVLLHDLIANRTTNADLLMGHIDHVAFSPDSRLFATLSDNLGFNLNLWETDNLRPLGRMETGGHSLSFSPDGERLAIGSGGKDAVSIWDVAGARQLLSLEGESRLVWWCEFSPDGNVIGALNGLGVLRLWRAPSWAEIEAAEKAGTW